VRFNENKDIIEILQDAIDFEVAFDYRAVTMPPIFADKGSLKIIIEDVAFQGDVVTFPSLKGKP
jgi:hypothetical protein